MKCPLCHSENIEPLSEENSEIFLCLDCAFYFTEDDNWDYKRVEDRE